jgi:hypothetical protein
MSDFDFGALEPDNMKPPKEPKISKPIEESTEPKKPRISESSRVSNEKVLEKLDSIEKQIATISSLLIQSPKQIIPNVEPHQSKIVEKQEVTAPLQVDKSLTEISESYILKIPELTDLNYLQNDISTDWYQVFRTAKRYGWLLNVYTFTRFLEHIDEMLKIKIKKPKLTTEWIRYKKKDEILKYYNLKWESSFLIRLGKTQQDIIDVFASNGNSPQSSNYLFEYLVNADPNHYDKNRDKNIDLRRVRNVLSQLNKEGFIETSRSINNIILFNIKKI